MDLRKHIVEVTQVLSDWLNLDLRESVRELESDCWLIPSIERAVADVPEFITKHWASPFDLGVFRVVLYALVRTCRPGYAIETGVLHGLTSMYMLAGFEANGAGRLVSIDLPSYFETGPANKDGFTDTLPRGRGSGWVVGPPYAGRWDLRLGPSTELLPAVFDENGPVGLFLHDSEHTYDTMWAELTAAWDNLGPDGIIVCDNVIENTSFFDLCRKLDRVPFVISELPRGQARFALITKERRLHEIDKS